MTIEVFKTNVCSLEKAMLVIKMIAEHFAGYRANFDLDDCDRILRIVNENGEVCSYSVIKLVNKIGFYAEVLPDE